MKKLTLLIAVIAILCLGMASNCFALAASFTYTSTYSSVSGVAGGYAVTTVAVASSGTNTLCRLFQIELYGFNSTADTCVFYDARTYTDATLNNRPILAKAVFALTSTFIYYGGTNKALMSAGIAGSSMGISVLGDSGATWDFTQKDGTPRFIKYGIIAAPHSGAVADNVANKTSFGVVFRND